MSHFEAAGYSILSFKYDPAKIKKEDDKDTEPISDADQGHGGGDGDALPSLSSLKASLQEIENMESSKEAESANSSSAGPATPAPCPPTAFHRFGDLPTELRIKIWSMSFLPRVVELRPTRPNYAPSRTDDRRTQVSSSQPQWGLSMKSSSSSILTSSTVVAIRLHQPRRSLCQQRSQGPCHRTLPHPAPFGTHHHRPSHYD